MAKLWRFLRLSDVKKLQNILSDALQITRMPWCGWTIRMESMKAAGIRRP